METILYVTYKESGPAERLLKASGYDLSVCSFDDDVLAIMDGDPYRVALLDFDPNETMARETIMTLRSSHPQLLLVAIDNSCPGNGQENAVSGLNAGADEYFIYPFDLRLLTAKIGALFRRMSLVDDGNGVFHFGKFALRYADRAVDTGDGGLIGLTFRETCFMRMLCLYRGRRLPKQVALKAIWHDDSYYNGRSMDVMVANLRKKLTPLGISIETERSRGYVLVT